MGIQTTMPGQWVDSDENGYQDTTDTDTDTTTTTTLLSLRSTSLTMEEDKSQPPTPDGTGLPTNFHLIGPGIYRSSYPQPAHFSKLKHYRFKTIITFVPEPIPGANTTFMSQTGITHHHIPVLANKDPRLSTPTPTVLTILNLMLDKRNHPLLIHCNKGKHRTGCVTACFRKATGWTDDACIAEYERYAAPKDRPLDKAFIRRFDAAALKAFALEHGFVGGAFALPYVQGSGDSERTVGTAVTDGSAVTRG